MNDGTSWFEALIEELANDALNMVEVMGPQLMPRAPLSTTVPKEAQHQQWAEEMENPQKLMEHYQTLTKLYGPDKGELILRKWDKEHREMVTQ